MEGSCHTLEALEPTVLRPASPHAGGPPEHRGQPVRRYWSHGCYAQASEPRLRWRRRPRLTSMTSRRLTMFR